MSQYISTTSGSKSILQNIIKRNPKHNLFLYKSNTENNFSLIDWEPTHLIFKSPISYKFIIKTHLIHYGPFISVYHFTLSHKELLMMIAYAKKQIEIGLPKNMINLFLAENTKNSSQIIIGTIWLNNENLIKWINSSFISLFLKDSTNNIFHNNLTQIK